MRHMILIGSTPRLEEQLAAELEPGDVTHVPVRIGRSSEALPVALAVQEELMAKGEDPLIAYGPGIFGAAATRLPAKLDSKGSQLMLVDYGPWPSGLAENPMEFADRARAVLRPEVVINPGTEWGMEALVLIMLGKGIAEAIEQVRISANFGTESK